MKRFKSIQGFAFACSVLGILLIIGAMAQALNAAEIDITSQSDFDLGEMTNLVFADNATGKMTLASSFYRVGPLTLNNGALPAPLAEFGSVVVGSRLYIAGGVSSDGHKRTDVASIALGALGPSGSWRSETPLPVGLSGCGLIFAGRHFYVSAADGSGTLYLASINAADGSIGNWAEAGHLPPNVGSHKLAVMGKRFVVLASDGQGLVFSSPLLADGAIGEWRAEAGVPSKAVGFSVVTTADRLLVLGGSDANSTLLTRVDSMSCNTDGTFSDWMSENPMPIGLAFHAAAVSQDLLVVSGGSSGSSLSNALVSASVQSDGHLGAWKQEGNFLPDAVRDHQMLFGSDYLLMLGGDAGTTKDSQMVALSLDYGTQLTAVDNVGGPPPFPNPFGYPTPSAGAIAIGNRIYSLGNTGDGRILSIGVLADSTLETSWRQEIAHPASSEPSVGGALAFLRGRLYFLEYPILAQTIPAIYSTAINADGTFAGWTASGVGPRKLSDFGVLTIGNRIYLFGGRDDTGGLFGNAVADVYSAPIASDGSIGAWQTETSLPHGANGCAVTVSGKRVLVSGGQIPNQTVLTGADVFMNTVLPDGHLGSWTLIAQLPHALQNHRMISSGGVLTVAGGYSWSTSSVGQLLPNPNIYSTTIDESGSIGTWSLISNSASHTADTVISRARTYIIGSDAVYSYSAPVFANSGTYFTSVFDLGSVRNLSAVSWDRITNPSGTALTVSLVTGTDSKSPMDNFSQIVSGLPISRLARFAQLRFDFHSANGLQTSSLDDFKITHYGDFTNPSDAPSCSIVDVSSTSMTVQVLDQSLDETGFEIFVDTADPPGGNATRTVSVSRSSGSYVNATLSNLGHGSEYFVRARGYNASDSLPGAFSDTVSTSTLIPAAGESVGVDRAIDGYVLTWKGMPQAVGYRIFDGGGRLLSTVSSATTSFQESDVGANTFLQRRVEAFDSVGPILIGSAAFYTLLPPPDPSSFQIRAHGEDWLEVTVTPPLGATSGRSGTKVYVRDEGIIVQTQFLSNGAAVARFEALPVGRTYNVTVSYLNGDGIETAEAGGQTAFEGIASESFEPAARKFIISDGIDFDLNSNAAVSGKLLIYDSNQRMIRQLIFNNPAGHSRVHWDGRDGSGKEEFSDVFWVRAETDRFGRRTFKVAGVR